MSPLTRARGVNPILYIEAEELTGWNWSKLKDCKMVAEAFNLEDRSSKYNVGS